MTIRPTSDNVLVKFNKTEEKSPGGILLVKEEKTQLVEATIVAVGPGRIRENGTRTRPEVEVGQKALVPRDSIEVMIEGVKHHIVAGTEIAAVFGPV